MPTKNMVTIVKQFAFVSLMLAAPWLGALWTVPAEAVTWSGGTAAWTAADGTKWIGGVAPVAGNTVDLTQAGGPFTITYLAGTVVPTTFGVLNLGNTSNLTTLSVGGNGGTAAEETLLTNSTVYCS